MAGDVFAFGANGGGGVQGTGQTIYSSDGTITDDRTIETNGNDIVFNDSVHNISFGIRTSLSGNKAFYVEHTDNGYTNYIINKLEQLEAIFSADVDITGSFILEQATNNIIGVYTGVDNVTGEIFSGMIYITAASTSELRFDQNGLRMQFDANPAFYFKQSGILNLPLPTYADDAAAGLAGLQKDDLYQTVIAGEGFVKIKQ